MIRSKYKQVFKKIIRIHQFLAKLAQNKRREDTVTSEMKDTIRIQIRTFDKQV